MHRQESLAEKRWNAEYGRGRYSGEAPVDMITRILAAARARNIDRGLYIGCGNGRNYIPLRRAGLDLTGIDISAEAIAQLRRQLPDVPAGCLQRGTVQDLSPEDPSRS